ncbi:hypothetical protein TNCV_1017071 [Trichonephila clavipes]|uniref:Uncharacterized protein n=1 Tax=Trichonephila clavipes TaxID=2585209 RepID=A0A8X7BA04_TRICX|nr:hypothetical protein TNCV_1017071 [Trichonephila clavipes]
MPPTHHWYVGDTSRLALALKCDRGSQTTLSRLRGGHIKCLSCSEDMNINLSLPSRSILKTVCVPRNPGVPQVTIKKIEKK